MGELDGEVLGVAEATADAGDGDVVVVGGTYDQISV